MKIDPNRITTKPKLHVLTHLSGDVRRFGPPALYEVEGFEASNKIFRQCSILSNHHAPSHDIAMTMARMERFKHVISGGWWWDKARKRYVRADERITKHFASNAALQHHLGWTPEDRRLPGNVSDALHLHILTGPSMLGSITSAPMASQPNDCTWDSLFPGAPPVRPTGVGEQTQLKVGESVVSRSCDMCSEGSWVFYNTHDVCLAYSCFLPAHWFPKVECPLKVARIFKIVTSKADAATSFIVLEQWNISEQKDEYYGMPTLRRNRNDAYFTILPEVRFLCYQVFQNSRR